MRFPAPGVTFDPCPAPGRDRRAEREDDVLSHQVTAAKRAAAAGKPKKGLSRDVSSDKLLERILASLDDDKAEEVIAIDLRGKSSIADHMVICSGRSSRQVAAISEKLADRLKVEFGFASRIEGRDTSDWVLIDAGDVIVHVFRPEVREFYQLEKMWQPTGADAGARTAKT